MTERAELLKALTALYDNAPAAQVAAFAREIGAERFRDLHIGAWGPSGLLKDFIRPDRPARDLDLEVLAVVHETGANLDPVVTTIMKRAIVRDAPDADRFLREVMGCTEPYADYFGLRWMIMHCGPRMAGTLASEIRPLVHEVLTARTDTDLTAQGCFSTYPLKAFAIAVLSGADAREIFRIGRRSSLGDWRPAPAIERMIEATASAHGRLWLHGLEPCFEKALGRHHSEAFLGLAEDDFRAALRRPA